MEDLKITTQSAVIKVPDDFIGVRQGWVEQKQQELVTARQALALLQESEATPRRIKRVQERVALLKKVVRALEKGYIPIPRFYVNKLTLDMEDLPIGAIAAINEAKAQHLFDEFVIASGQPQSCPRGPYGRERPRDPLIIGVVRSPFHEEWHENPRHLVNQWGGEEEYFLIA